MRIWDVHPGYLDDARLLAEHCELHGVVAVLAKRSPAAVRHPEAKRWCGFGWALRQRHRLLAEEMALRGFRDRMPVRTRSAAGVWPQSFIDSPGTQFSILAAKYAAAGAGAAGRIPLPRNAQQLWAQHKYSVMARDQVAYRDFGRRVASLRRRDGFDELARELAEWLRRPPSEGNLVNAVQHMWGYVDTGTAEFDATAPGKALEAIQRAVHRDCGEGYLLSQTALSDLAAW